MIKAIIFDVDGTLLDSFESNLIYFQNLMKAAGYQPPTLEEYRPFFHMTMMAFIKQFTGSNSEDEIMRIFKLAQNTNIDYPIEKMAKDASQIVRLLSKDYRLGIVTSRVRTSVFEAPEMVELEKLFETTVTYEDTTNHKPHPEPLFLAAKKLDLDPKHCVYVGDTENDMLAAKAAGMDFILYGRVDSPKSFTDFLDLPNLIK